LISSSLTAYTPFTSPRSWMIDQGILPTGVRSPSAMVAVAGTVGMRVPERKPRRQSSAPLREGSAPKTRVGVPLQARAVPERRPAPPQGVIMALRVVVGGIWETWGGGGVSHVVVYVRYLRQLACRYLGLRRVSGRVRGLTYGVPGQPFPGRG
jgi:hypothetical protein